MTAVISFYYLTGFLVIADTRVSFDVGSKRREYDKFHGIQKILPLQFNIGNRSTHFVFGYAGDVGLAQLVIHYIFSHKMLQYQREFMPSIYAEDLLLWANEAIRGDSRYRDRTLHIMFVGCDITKRRPLNIQLNPPFFEPLCFLYQKLQGKDEFTLQKSTRDINVIGSGQKFADFITAAVLKPDLFNPNEHYDKFRSYFIMDSIRWKFLAEKDKTVGGPWQLFWCTPHREHGSDTCWINEAGDVEGEVEKIRMPHGIRIIRPSTKTIPSPKFTMVEKW
jgi:hypothetical protein